MSKGDFVHDGNMEFNIYSVIELSKLQNNTQFIEMETYETH